MNSAQQQQVGARPTKVLDPQDHQLGITSHAPIEHLLGFLVFATGFVICTLLQITSTEEAVFGLLQLSIQVNPAMTAQQITDFMNGQLDRNHSIAYAIGWIVQLFIFSLAFPSDGAFALARKRHSRPSMSTPSVQRKAMLLGKIKVAVTWSLIIADIVTDMAYVLEGHSIIVGWQIHNAGGLLIALMYPVAITGGTLFFGGEAFKRLGALLESLNVEFPWNKQKP